MINALEQQFQGLTLKLTALESKIDAANSVESEIRCQLMGDNQISTIQQPPGSYKKSHTESDFIRHEGKFHFPWSDRPGFHSDNLVEWLRKCHSNFELHQITDMYKRHFVTIQFDDSIIAWNDGYLIDHDPPPWSELVCLAQL
jgi:hypothetical protein